MTDDLLASVPARLRILGERRGLTRALALVPALSRPSLERALQPLSPVPTGAVTEPASVFAPDMHRDET